MIDNNKKNNGHLHPITITINQVVEIFNKLGFSVVGGPEVESEYYNFDALNVPPDHPAREMQDTFWIKNRKDGADLLRTQTSAVQVRYMEKNKPPIKIVVPGKVYRNEATDATHEAQFFQIELLQVTKDSSLAELKGVIEYFIKEMFGEKTKMRMRPSYFPFVEPGLEIDMTCFKCKGNGCAMCKRTGWVEIGGAGMVHPYVFNACGIDPREYRGFAFGFGIDRLVMMKYEIDDIRHFYSGDLRFINQF